MVELSSNVTADQMNEIIELVPDTIDNPDEYWRIVPDTMEGTTYSVSSKRDILVKHTSIDTIGRTWKCKLITMSYDAGVYNTSIKRSSKDLSTYIEHVRYDAFPELNVTKTLQDDLDDAVDIAYEGIDWYGRRKIVVHLIPVTDTDMIQVRRFYPEDLPRELWAYVPGSNRKYVVSTQSRGVILKRYRTNGQILKAQKWQLQSGGEDGSYYSCCLTVGDVQTNSVAHSQVLRSFITQPTDGYYEVNHIDGDKHNNCLDNLEWVTRQQNSDHYNNSPEMLSKRQEGYRKISEWGRVHQREIQNRPEVNLKRSVSVRETWTEERKNRQREITKARWANLTAEQRKKCTQGFIEYNESRRQNKLKAEIKPSES